MKGMKYRKISPQIWNDRNVREMSDHGKLAFLFMLTHPHMTSLGAIRSSLPGLACELGWAPEAFAEAFEEAHSKGMVEHDEKACLIWFPNFIKHNLPESPNVIRSWAGGFQDLPECDMKDRLLVNAFQQVKALSKGFQKAFREAFGEVSSHPLLNQEQEQEQEYKKERDSAREAGADSPDCSRKLEAEPAPPEDEAVPPKASASPPAPTYPEYTPDFLTWMEVYGEEPNDGAWHAWKATVRRAECSLSLLMDSLNEWQKSRQWADGFVPLAKNFLKEGYWQRKPREENKQAARRDGDSHPIAPRSVSDAAAVERDRAAMAVLEKHQRRNDDANDRANTGRNSGTYPALPGRQAQ